MLDKTRGRSKNESRRRRGRQRMSWLDGITDSIDGHEFEQDPGVDGGQGSLACCSPWGCKESDTSQRLNDNNIIFNGEKNECLLSFNIKNKIRMFVLITSVLHCVRGFNYSKQPAKRYKRCRMKGIDETTSIHR